MIRDRWRDWRFLEKAGLQDEADALLRDLAHETAPIDPEWLASITPPKKRRSFDPDYDSEHAPSALRQRRESEEWDDDGITGMREERLL